MRDIEIPIRSIQHYLYCPHRWGLLEINKAWAENAFVTKANLLHKRVHDPDRSYTSRGKRVVTSVSVYNDIAQYNLYGVVDCLELTESKTGVSIPGEKEKYQICIVEYKPSHPKEGLYHEEDAMQVFAQKTCVDYIFGGDCDAVIYYADIKKRIPLPFREQFQEYDVKLRNTLRIMRANIEGGIIPQIARGQNCSGCSMKDLCLPMKTSTENTYARIHRIGRQEI